MQRCPSCGFHNPETRDRCLKCSAALKSVDVKGIEKSAERHAPALSILPEIRKVWYRIGEKLTGPLPSDLPHRFPWTAAHLSLIPGAGQLYNHQPGKAGIFITIFVVLLAINVYTIFMAINNWIMLGFVFWIFYQLSDGFVTACKINGQPWHWKQLLAVWFAMMFYCGIFLMLMQFMGTYALFQLITIRSERMGPHLQSGDKVFVLSPWLAGKPEPGDLIFYDPRSYAIEIVGALMSDTVIVNEMNSFGVVNARPGEVITTAATGEILIDGVPAPPKRLPLVPNGVPRIPETRVEGIGGILISHGSENSGFLSVVGGSFAGSVATPRTASGGGIMKDFEQTISVQPDEYFGKAVLIYFPPERRRWFGFSNGVWEEPPAGYPQRY